MSTLATKILENNKLSFGILRPLILETALKLQEDLPQKMQTGPARRGDNLILKKHRMLLKNDPELKKIYTMLSKSIEKKYKQRN